MTKEKIKKYHAIVIGSGQAGNPLAFDLSDRGQKVALIEKDQLGGACINFGCTPTKTLIASSNIHHRVKTSEALGVSSDNVRLDFKKIMTRKNNIVTAFRGTIERKIIVNKNIDLYRGTGSFIDKNTIKISSKETGEEKIYADKIYINVGSKPNIIPLDGLKEIDYHDSTSIMELDSLPEHLVIVGTGYIALEFGQMFRRFGSQVTMIGRSDSVLKKEDRDVSDRIQDILEKDGINFLLNTDTKRVEKDGHLINVYVDKDGKEEKISASHFMLAVGRVPATEELNLKNAGVELDDKGYIKVSDRLKTTSDNIYALGDVKGGPQFTHIARDDYRVVMDDVFGQGDRTIKDRLIPYTLYIEPQLGRVGLTEEEARNKGYNIVVSKIEMATQGRPIEENYTDGFMKAVINKDNDRILGVSILGYQGGEIMAIVEVAMMADMPYQRLRDGIFTHPSLSEILNDLFDI